MSVIWFSDGKSIQFDMFSFYFFTYLVYPAYIEEMAIMRIQNIFFFISVLTKPNTE